MKNLRKIALVLVCVLMVGVLGGCGAKFDAQGYLKALMDNSYKNDSTDFVEMKLGTAEEATALYEQGVDTYMKAFIAELPVSEELEEEFRNLFKDMLAKSKYTVDGAEKLEDGSYKVTISYEQFKIFKPTLTEYNTVITEMSEEWMQSEEPVSEEVMMDEMILALKDCMAANLQTAEYAEPAQTEVRIQLVDGVYTPNSQDVMNLEKLLFDIEAAQ